MKGTDAVDVDDRASDRARRISLTSDHPGAIDSVGDRASAIDSVSDRAIDEPPIDARLPSSVDALEESEARYRTLFDQTPVGVFTFDRNLRVTDCNPALVRLLRSPHERLLGLDLRTLRDTTLIPAVERVLDGEPLYAEGPYEATMSDARLFLAVRLTPLRNASGDVVGGMGMMEDVTVRRAGEEALRRSEARFRTLVELAPDAVGVFRDGLHVYGNDALARYLGFTKGEELIGLSVPDLIHPDDRAMFHRRNKLRAAGVKLSPQEYRLVRRDGATLIAEITSMTLDYDGTPAVLVIMRDLTERKLLQLQLLQSDRMASVGTLAAGIAHEINNPLSYLMTNLEVIARYRLPELEKHALGDATREIVVKLAEMIASARDGAERVRSIVRDVKMFSRASDDEAAQPVDVRAVLDASLHLVDNELRHRARLVREYADVPRVHANESRLGQVFLNLLVNAVQSLPARPQNEIRVRVYGDEENVVVEVTDTGDGIPPDVASRVFDPFFTTKPLGVGTGLGLFVCQGIVTALGGTLGLESKVGQGTTFRVTLPARFAPISERPNVSRSSAFVPSRRGRLLVIDDEPSMGRALVAALSDEHDVTFVTSGREAIDLLGTDARFDLVLCDLMMPDMTGMDVWDHVARDVPRFADRFVFVTGGAFTPQARAFLEARGGLDGSGGLDAERGGGEKRACLEKPFDLNKLRGLLNARVAKSGG